MERRGATLSAGLFATLLAAESVTATVPAALVQTTTVTAMTFLAGGAVAPPVLILAREGIQMLGFPKLTAATALAVLLGGLTVGAGALMGPVQEKNEPSSPKSEARNLDQPPPPAGAVARLGTARFRHGAAVSRILVTPDGQTILTQGQRSVRFWDAKSGEDRGAIDLTDDGPDFWTSSLTPDGKTLLTTRRNGTAQVWNLADRKLQRSFRLAEPPFDPNTLSRAAHAPDGSAIAVVTQDGSIRVCDVAAGRERPELRSHSDAVRVAEFTSDSKSLFLATDASASLLQWDAMTGRQITRLNFRPGMLNLVVSPDGTRVIGYSQTQPNSGETGRGQGGSQRRIEELVVKEIGGLVNPYTLGGHASAATALAFTPDGNFLLAPDRLSNNRILLQWDLATRRAVRQFLPLAGSITALAFTPDGQTLITADDALHFWNWKTGNPIDRPSDPVRIEAPGFVQTGTGLLASPAGEGAGIVVREVATGREIRRFVAGIDGQTKPPLLTALAVSQDGRTIVAAASVPTDIGPMGSWESALWVWDLTNGNLRHRLPTAHMYSRLALNHDGTLLAATSRQDAVAFWGLKAGQPWEMPGGVKPPANTLIGFLPDGATFATFDPSRMAATFWTLATGEVTYVEAERGDGGGFRRGAGSPKGRGGARGSPLLSDPSRGMRLGRSSAVVTVGPDFRMAAEGYSDSGGPANAVRVADLKVGQYISTIGGSRYEIRFVALSNDARRVAAATDTDTPTITAWDVATGRELRRFTGLRGHATGLEFTPDSKRLVAASSDGTLLVWDVPE